MNFAITWKTIYTFLAFSVKNRPDKHTDLLEIGANILFQENLEFSTVVFKPILI